MPSLTTNSTLFYLIPLVYIDLVASETFKWEDLNDAIASGSITTMSPIVLKYNQRYRYGERLKDYVCDGDRKESRKRRGDGFDFERDQVALTKEMKLRNIYDRGYYYNLKEVFFPKKLSL